MEQYPKKRYEFTRKPNCKCSTCENPIYRRPFQLKKGPVYCCQKCYGKACTKLVFCKICGKEFNSGLHKITCSRVCSNINRTGIKYKKVSNRPTKENVSSSRSLKNRLVLLRGDKCQICAFPNTKILHVHHIIERSNGGTDNLDNLLLICPNCHATIHYGN